MKLLKPRESELEIFLKNSETFTIRDRIAPNFIEEKRDSIVMGNNFTKTYVIVDYPNKVIGNWLSDLRRFKGNLNISTHMVPASADKMIKFLDSSIQELSSRLDDNNKPTRELELKQKMKSAHNLLEKLMEGDNPQIYLVHMYLHITASSQQELDKVAKRLEMTVRRKGMNMHVPYHRMMDALQSIVPVLNNKLPEYSFRNMDTEAASSLFPFDESELFMETGIIRGINVTTNSLVVIDKNKLTSSSEFVVGKTGMGKSFYLQISICRRLMNDERVFAIDPEGELSKLITKLDGQVIDISASSSHVINPLEVRLSQDEKQDALRSKIQRLKIFFKMIKPDLLSQEIAYLEDALIETYKEKGIHFDSDFEALESLDYPILGDLYRTLDKEEYRYLESFKTVLKMYVEGSNSRLFNGHTNVNLNSHAVSFNLRGLENEGDAQAASMYLILTYLWDECTNDTSVFTSLYVDEAHILASPDSPQAMRFLYQAFKRIRKYFGAVTVATQQVQDFMGAVEGSRNYGEAIISNANVKLILGLEQKDVKYLRDNEIIRLSEQEETIIAKQIQGEGIFSVGTKRVHMKVDYTPYELKLVNEKQYQEEFGVVV